LFGLGLATDEGRHGIAEQVNGNENDYRPQRELRGEWGPEQDGRQRRGENDRYTRRQAFQDIVGVLRRDRKTTMIAVEETA